MHIFQTPWKFGIVNNQFPFPFTILFLFVIKTFYLYTCTFQHTQIQYNNILGKSLCLLKLFIEYNGNRSELLQSHLRWFKERSMRSRTCVYSL